MSIKMPKGLPFSVGTWSPSSKRKRHHFLTHAHKDHSTWISSHFSYLIYSTHLTKPSFNTTPRHKAGQSVAIDDLDGAFTDTAFDANHCPGGVVDVEEGNISFVPFSKSIICVIVSEALVSGSNKGSLY